MCGAVGEYNVRRRELGLRPWHWSELLTQQEELPLISLYLPTAHLSTAHSLLAHLHAGKLILEGLRFACVRTLLGGTCIY